MAITMLRLPALIERTGESRSSIYRRTKDGTFPPPVKLGPRVSAWPAHEADAISRARIAGKSDDEIRLLVRTLVAARVEVTPAAPLIAEVLEGCHAP
jgi:prophage regulatory protein